MSEQISDKAMSKWETAERISKTLSMVAIPVVLAFGGWMIQQRLQNQTLNRDYVQLAVSILKEPPDSKIDPEMRTWAVQLLNDNSPTRFNSAVFAQLKSGTVQLPEDFKVTQDVSPAPVASGNSHADAADLEKKGFAFLISKDVEGALQAFTEAEELWPKYHSVAEIRKLLDENRSALAAAPKQGKSEAWSKVYRIILTDYSWKMPEDAKKKLSEELQ